MFCSNCGNKLNDSDKFCNYCGNKIQQYENFIEKNINNNIEKTNEKVKNANGLGITGFILGIIAFIIAFIPIVNVISFILALIGLVFSIIGICMKGKKAMPIIGLILCAFSFFILHGINDTYCTIMEEKENNTINTTYNTTQTSKKENSSNFTLLSSDITCTKSFSSYYDTYITGEIKNNTNKKYSYVGVTFILYDEDGAQIGTAVDNIFDLEPNGTWKFKATTLEYDKVSSFKLSNITSW